MNTVQNRSQHGLPGKILIALPGLQLFKLPSLTQLSGFRKPST